MNNKPPMQAKKTEAPQGLSTLSSTAGVLTTLVLIAWVVVQGRQFPGKTPPNFLQPPQLNVCAGQSPGYLIGRLHGTLQRDIDWSGDGLKCTGMLRPKGAGIRLLFAQNNDDENLLFVLGIPSFPDSAAGRELPINLTIVDEKAKQFYNSGESERCWVTISESRRINVEDSKNFFLAGDLYCLGALAAINGAGAVTPSEFRFAGYLFADE